MRHFRITVIQTAGHGRAPRDVSIKWRIICRAAAALGVLLAALRAEAGLVLDDPLQGSTKGTRSGGVFVAGGWKVTGANDCIYWHVPTVIKGAVEWEVRGLQPGECRTGMEDKTELFHMYDYNFGDSDANYNGGYRDNPYKHFVRKIDCVGGTIDAMELVWKIGDEYTEPDTPVLPWSPAVTYRFREEWAPEGANTRFKTFRNGALVMSVSLPGVYQPAGLSIRIAASNRRDSASGAPIDAIYSNVKAWDLSQPDPAPPLIGEMKPDPDFTAPGVEYVRQLTLEAGSPPPAFEVIDGPPGLRVDPNGRVSGWTPAATEVGSRFNVEVRAVNSQGSDVESWLVEVTETKSVSFPFNQDVEGWTLSVWKSGAYDPGTIAWDPAGGHPGGNIRVMGSGETNNLDSCTREGGYLTRVISTAGLRSLRVQYDVIASLEEPPGISGAGNCPVLGGSSDDKLVVYYSSRGAGGPWTPAQTILEPDLPLEWVRRTIDLSGVPAAGDNPAFALRFHWQFNAKQDTGRIDNIRIEGALIEHRTAFQRGDPNADGRLDISDALHLLGYLFLGESGLACEKAADVDDAGTLDISDAVFLLGYLFLGGEVPPPPLTGCGFDPTPDELTCPSFGGCK